MKHEQQPSPRIWLDAPRPPDGTEKPLFDRLRVPAVITFGQQASGNSWWPLERPLFTERAVREAWARRDRA